MLGDIGRFIQNALNKPDAMSKSSPDQTFSSSGPSKSVGKPKPMTVDNMEEPEGASSPNHNFSKPMSSDDNMEESEDSTTTQPEDENKADSGNKGLFDRFKNLFG